MSSQVIRRGWRKFQCFECGHEWQEATRDHQSPSVEICQKRSESCQPVNSSSDESLKVDHLGNLV